MHVHPVIECLEFLVIGENHSAFAPRGEDPAHGEQIAVDLTSAIPEVNTFVCHKQQLAKGLQAVCDSGAFRGWTARFLFGLVQDSSVLSGVTALGAPKSP